MGTSVSTVFPFTQRTFAASNSKIRPVIMSTHSGRSRASEISIVTRSNSRRFDGRESENQ